eukprot:scaffold36319_cov53-Phaeocystis_antarctica.AAC.8
MLSACNLNPKLTDNRGQSGASEEIIRDGRGHARVARAACAPASRASVGASRPVVTSERSLRAPPHAPQ